MKKQNSFNRIAPKRNVIAPNNADEGIVVLDLNLKPIAADCGALAILADPNRGLYQSESVVYLPAELFERLTNSPPGHQNCTTIHLQIGVHNFSCRAYLLEPQNDVFSQSMLVLHLRRASYLQQALHRVGLEYHLTDREQEALLGISMGLTSKELAARMDISPNTVKTFLRMMMLKMGVTTRTGMLSKVLGQAEPESNRSFGGQSAG